MLKNISVGMLTSKALPNGVVTTTHVKVSCAPFGPMVSRFINLDEERYMISMPSTLTYVKLYEFAVLVYGCDMSCAEYVPPVMTKFLEHDMYKAMFEIS